MKKIKNFFTPKSWQQDENLFDDTLNQLIKRKIQIDELKLSADYKSAKTLAEKLMWLAWDCQFNDPRIIVDNIVEILKHEFAQTSYGYVCYSPTLIKIIYADKREDARGKTAGQNLQDQILELLEDNRNNHKFCHNLLNFFKSRAKEEFNQEFRSALQLKAENLGIVKPQTNVKAKTSLPQSQKNPLPLASTLHTSQAALQTEDKKNEYQLLVEKAEKKIANLQELECELQFLDASTVLKFLTEYKPIEPINLRMIPVVLRELLKRVKDDEPQKLLQGSMPDKKALLTQINQMVVTNDSSLRQLCALVIKTLAADKKNKISSRAEILSLLQEKTQALQKFSESRRVSRILAAKLRLLKRELEAFTNELKKSTIQSDPSSLDSKDLVTTPISNLSPETNIEVQNISQPSVESKIPEKKQSIDDVLKNKTWQKDDTLFDLILTQIKNNHIRVEELNLPQTIGLPVEESMKEAIKKWQKEISQTEFKEKTMKTTPLKFDSNKVAKDDAEQKLVERTTVQKSSKTPQQVTSVTSTASNWCITGADKDYGALNYFIHQDNKSKINKFKYALREIELNKYPPDEAGKQALELAINKVAKIIDENIKASKNPERIPAYQQAIAKLDILDYVKKKRGWDIESLIKDAGWYGPEISKMLTKCSDQAVQERQGLLCLQPSEIAMPNVITGLQKIQERLLSRDGVKNCLPMLGIVGSAWNKSAGSHYGLNIIIDNTLIVFDPLGGDKITMADSAKAISRISKEKKLSVVVVSNKLQRDGEQDGKPESSCGPISVALAQKFFELGPVKIRKWLATLPKQAEGESFRHQSADLTQLLDEEKEDDGIVSLVKLTSDKSSKVDPHKYNACIKNIKQQHVEQVKANKNDSRLQTLIELRLNINAGYLEDNEKPEAIRNAESVVYPKLKEHFVSKLPSSKVSAPVGQSSTFGSTITTDQGQPPILSPKPSEDQTLNQANAMPR